MPCFFHHCTPARAGLGTRHSTLQLLEAGVQPNGQLLDKTPLQFRKGLFLGKECSTGHLLVLCFCARQRMLSTVNFRVARSIEIHAFPCISHSVWVFLKATNRGNIKGSLSPWSFIAVAGLRVHTYVLWSSMSGRVSCLSLLAQHKQAFFTALTFQVWTSTWWCLCKVGTPLLFRNDHSSTSLISWPGWWSTCKWHFSITSLWWALGCDRLLDFWTTDQWRQEKAGLMEKPHTTSLQLHIKSCICSFVLAPRDTHSNPKRYCHRGNCRDLQIAGDLNRKLAFLLPAPSTGRERGAGGTQDFRKPRQQSADKLSSCLCAYCQPGVLTLSLV